MEFTSLYAAYGLDPASLSAERKAQLEGILRGAGQAAGRAALEEATRILQQEAAKRGLNTGTTGSQEQLEAERIALEEARRLADEAAARKRRNTIIGVGAGILVLLVGAVIWTLRRKTR